LLLDFTDKPNQKAFFFDRSRVCSFWGGYGNGKTYAGCGKGVTLSLNIPGNVGLVGRKTYPALNSTTRESFLSFVRQLNGGQLGEGPIVHSFNKSENILQFKNGSKVFFRTLDEVEKLRSLNLGWALVDQAEEIDEEIFLELNGRLRLWNPEKVAVWQKNNHDALTAALGFVPKPYNQLIIVGNPSPKAWVRREFFENEGGKNKVYSASTLENQKYLPTEYIAELTARYSKEWIGRFINGSWDTMLGQIYKDFDFEGGVHSIPPFDIPQHWPRFIALDHGIVNPTAVLWGAIDEAGRVYVYHEYYVAGKGVEEHAEAIKEICKVLGNTPMTQDNKIKIFMDYSLKGDYDPHGLSAWEHYNRRGIFGLNANKAVQDGIQTVQLYLKPRQDRTYPQYHPRAGQPGAPGLFIFDGACPWLVKELKAYEWEENREGSNASEQPKKFFDHLADALRYLCQAIREQHSPEAKATKTAEQEAAERLKAIAAHAFMSPDAEDENNYQ